MRKEAAASLEVAKGLVLANDRRFWQVKLDVAGLGPNGGPLSLYASDNPEGIYDVVEGKAAMALVNPSVMLTLAYRGTGPFSTPQPVRAIAVMPSYDLFAFVVTADTGLTSLEDVRERRFPLQISMRGQRSHSIHTVLDYTLRAAGFSVDELVGWGGGIHYEGGFDAPERSGFDAPERLKMAQDGTINAIFDEAIVRWLDKALDIGMRALPLGATTIRNLEALGFRRNVLEAAVYPKLGHDVETIDFSGFAIFVREDAPDDLVTSICAGLDLRRDRVPWEGAGPLPVAHMVRDTPDGPLDVPLHPAAERYWKERGYRTGGRSPDEVGQQHPRPVPVEPPPRIRSMLTLEVASEILARADAAAPGAFATRIGMRQQTQDFGDWFVTVEAAEAAATRADIAAGRVDVAVVPTGGATAARSVATFGDDELIVRPGLPDDVVTAFQRAAEARRGLIRGA